MNYDQRLCTFSREALGLTWVESIREEIRNQTDNSYKVVEHTKTNKDRFVVVVPKALDILNRIERQGEYIFMNACGVPLDCIREMLGHSSLSTTLSYIYNPLTEKETFDLITKAL